MVMAGSLKRILVQKVIHQWEEEEDRKNRLLRNEHIFVCLILLKKHGLDQERQKIDNIG